MGLGWYTVASTVEQHRNAVEGIEEEEESGGDLEVYNVCWQGGGGYTRLLAWTTPCGPPLSIIVDCDYYTITPWLIEY